MRSVFIVLSSLCVVVSGGCKKEPEVASPAAPSRLPKPSSKAEVEFVGKWTAGELLWTKAVFVAQAEPCTPVPASPTRYGEQALSEAGSLFAEFFIEQGAKGFACIYAWDGAGKLVGVAGTAQNPMTFEGEGEVVKARLDFVLAPPTGS